MFVTSPLEEVIKINIKEQIDLVYNLFLDSLVLNKEHKKYLIHVWGVIPNRVEKDKYKSYPDILVMNSIMDDFLKKLKENYIHEDILEGITGFSKSLETGNWHLSLIQEGILIPLRNSKEQIIGLELLEMKQTFIFGGKPLSIKEKEPSISPINVIYPNVSNLSKLSSDLFIVSKRFTGEVLAARISSAVIVIPEIEEWKGISAIIDEAEEIIGMQTKKDFKIEKIYVAYEPIEFINNEERCQSIKLMMDNIYLKNSTRDVNYLSWSHDYKNISDALNSRDQKAFRSYDVEAFAEMFDKDENSDEDIYYLYRFLDVDKKVVYVGKTNNIDKRIKAHFRQGHLEEWQYDDVDTIEYLVVKSESDQYIGELFFINKYKPLYNTQGKKDSVLYLKVDINREWLCYESNMVKKDKCG